MVTLLKEVSPLYQDDAVYNLAYIDYVEKRYDKALKSFQSLQNDAVYAALVPYYIGDDLFGERKLSAGPYCGKMRIWSNIQLKRMFLRWNGFGERLVSD